MKCYSELAKLKTFDERFRYLQLFGKVGEETFGYDRWINQRFYQSREWKQIKNQVIFRDSGCDLGIEGCEICGKLLVHHINPLTVDDIKLSNDNLFNLENLILVSYDTHQAIHYGNRDISKKDAAIRTKNDTCPWKGVNNDI